MQLDIENVKLAQARTGKTLAQLGIHRDLLYRARKGTEFQPTTVHKIAAALGCDPAEIIKGGGSR